MSQSASQAAAFYREVAANECLWLLEDDGEVLIARAGAADEHEVTPAFSSEKRARRALGALENPPSQYASTEPVAYAWGDFCDDVGRRLSEEGVRLGVNWTGVNLVGYDLTVDDVIEAVEAQRD